MAQPVYERHTYEVYNYLYRLAQKGIVEFNDNVRPLSKTYIHSVLDSAAIRIAELSETEKKELAFYLREFKEGERKRILSAKGEGFTLYSDPILTSSYTGGKGTDVKSTSLGINFWGRIGKNLGYQFSFHDINEKGKGLDTAKKSLFAGNTTGIVNQTPFATSSASFTELRANLRYEFKNGAVSVGQDYLLWGYGEAGRLVLSDKAPVYPYIRLDYQPLPWLKFNYTHAWLRSNMVDSSRSYPIPTGNGYRTVEISKYMASHSIDINLTKKLVLSLGESIIYNDRLNIGYLIPIMFFKAIDNNSNSTFLERGSNGQFFFQLSSRNQLKNTHLYGTLFIDEVRLTGLFNKTKQRNQLGYTVGGSLTDVAGINYLTLGAEYTRVRPFVYRNILSAQNYVHQGYLMGDWIGSNADRLIVYTRYTPVQRLKLYARYTHLRKGGPGTLDQQYLQQPQPSFLFDFQQRSDEFLFNASYEYIHRLYLNMQLRRFDQQNIINLGLTYGL
ncbi:capsule assembly Wzi family protein [Sediminibacterium sp.]|uniref:capsule assembly Wzi family protein n=1 Tax=Sediminibacterium sp. TaxID=1917865 RepID=UPI0025FF4260|nr:capsule assembly Wzi family protein [Sediminibacterium sp.]MBW0177707.1 capsule assembly Wzi family protein [Sediminibacterium sp.]